MRLRTMMKQAGVSAQTCEITELSPALSETFLSAQNALIANQDGRAAARQLAELRFETLNCYEKGAVLGLSAQIKLMQGDFLGAAGDLRASLDGGYIPADERLPMLKSLGQIYLAEAQYDDGLPFMTKWMEAGGEPVRDEKWTLASVYALQEDYQAALFWAEQVLEVDGENADPSVLDFLDYLYVEKDLPEKKAALARADE